MRVKYDFIEKPSKYLKNFERPTNALLVLLLVWLTGSPVLSDFTEVKPDTAVAAAVFKATAFSARSELFKRSLVSYQLKRGENLYRISQKYFVSLETLAQVNQVLNPAMVYEGQKIYIPPVDFGHHNLQRYQVRTGETIASLRQRFGLEQWEFTRLNPNVTTVYPGMVLNLPRFQRYYHRYSQLTMIKPVRGYITSRFGFRWGRMHNGIDIAAPHGTPVYAAASGKVVKAEWYGGYGLLIKIDHGKTASYYGHLSKILVKNGAWIRQGELIGLVGATGRAFGSHLHFEVETGGRKLNPEGYLTHY